MRAHAFALEEGSASPREETRPTTDFLPHVVAWNLTKRCNLACAHCYISAGSWQAAKDELTTHECLRIADEILDVNPAPMFILSGGEPLLRDDLEEIAGHASSSGATVVVGTNGTRLTGRRIDSLMEAGVTGVAVSVDSLNPAYHDRFRHGSGALADTMAAVDRLERHGLDFIIQTSVTRGNRAELPELAAWAAERGAVSFNLYFLVPTGRGEGMQGLTPEENEGVLEELLQLESTYRGRMMVRSKCRPEIMRLAHQGDPESPLLNYRTRCPCGEQYCRITPEGKVTPCPYSPVVAGDLREEPFHRVWSDSPVFRTLREGSLSGKCGRCEYREVCGGCRARAFAVTGDMMGPDESCAHEPDPTADLVRPRAGMLYGTPAPAASIPWTDGAQARIQRVPSFVRGVVMARVEGFARDRGYPVVDEAVMAEVRSEMPVDFSKRIPFFLSRGGDA
ncbi:MAG: radical SAM protein [Gemmatimonadota bacterium]